MQKPEFIPLPKELKKKAGNVNGKTGYCRGYIAVHEELKDGKVWCYVFIPVSRWDVEKRKYTYNYNPDHIVVMSEKSWKTWDGEKWGKKVINPNDNYSGVIYDKNIDRDIFGKTIEEMQEEKRCSAAEKREAKRQEAISGITSKMIDTPEKIKKWAHLNQKHYIIFESRKDDGYCTNCGTHSRYDRIKNREYIRCPSCGHTYEARTYKTVPYQTSRCYMWFQETQGGYLLRNFSIIRKNPKDPDYESSETIKEYLCGAFIDGEEQWIEKRHIFDTWLAGYEERDKWYLNRVRGASRNILSPFYECSTYNAGILKKKSNYEYSYLEPATYGNIEEWIRITKSELGYIKEYIEVKDAFSFIKYNEVFEKVPQIEGLYKNGFDLLAKEAEYRHLKADNSQTELHKFLQIRKETFRVIMNYYWKSKLSWDDIDTLRTIETTDIKPGEYENMLKSIKQWDAWVIKQIAEDNGTQVSTIWKWLKSLNHGSGPKSKDIRTYSDYISMCRKYGIDLSDRFNLLPRDLYQAHDSILKIRDERKRIEEQEKAEKMDSEFMKAIGKNIKKFTLITDDFVIRPARSATEIVIEGQNQHNCVGKAGYIEKMMRHECMILFLRKKENENESYYTVETDMKGNIIQAFAKANKRTPDYEDVIKPLLEKLRKKVQRGKKRVAV